jgi:hypothetical protein
VALILCLGLNLWLFTSYALCQDREAIHRLQEALLKYQAADAPLVSSHSPLMF